MSKKRADLAFKNTGWEDEPFIPPDYPPEEGHDTHGFNMADFEKLSPEKRKEHFQRIHGSSPPKKSPLC